MKLFHKIFLCFVVIFSIAFQTAGILLINFAYENAVEQEKKYALQQFQYNKYILQSVFYSEPDILQEEITSIGDRSGFTVPVALYDSDRECIYTDMAAGSVSLHQGVGGQRVVFPNALHAEDDLALLASVRECTRNGITEPKDGFYQYSAAWDSKHRVNLETGKSARVLFELQQMTDGGDAI